MSIFSNCSGPCCLCKSADGNCLVGNGDDFYSPASKEQIIKRLDEDKYHSHRKQMITFLQSEFDYTYEEKINVKYLAKSTLEKGILLKYDSKAIFFDTEEEAKEACEEMNAYPNTSVVPVPVDEDVILSLYWYCHKDHPILINYKDIKNFKSTIGR